MDIRQSGISSFRRRWFLKTITVVMLCCSLLLQVTSAYAVNYFSDIRGNPAASYINTLAREGILRGDIHGRFRPRDAVSRAEFAALLVRVVRAVSTEPFETRAPQIFRDVKDSSWYYSAVQEATLRNLVHGRAGGCFYPNKPISRQEAAVALARAMDPKLNKLVLNRRQLGYKDSGTVDNWAVKGVVLTGSRGISSPRKLGYFVPKAALTRDEMATMLVRWLQFKRRVMVPVLTYHHLVREGQPIPRGAAAIGEKAFASQMQMLVNQGYHTITTDQLDNFLRQGIGLPDKPVMVTFDDGYRSNYTLAFPIMKKLGIKGVINVVVSSTPGEKSPHPDMDPVAHLPHLTWGEMREMEKSGLIEIQSHSYNSHGTVKGWGGKPGPTLVTRKLLPSGRLETPSEYQARIAWDLKKARLTLEKHLCTKVTALAYPYGSYNAITAKAAKAAGYTMTFSSRRGLVGKGDSLWLIKRINIEAGDDMAVFQKKLLSGLK